MTGRIGIMAHVARGWSDLWQVEANINVRLAERYPTVWMNPPLHWREAIRGPRPPAGFHRPAGAGRLEVYTPPAWLPDIHRPEWLCRVWHRGRLRQVYRHLRSAGVEKVVLYVWRPQYAEALDLVPHAASIYHVCDEYSFSPDEQPDDPKELRLLRDADQVIVHSPALMERKGGINPHTVLIPNGVDFAWFADQCEEPPDLAEIPHPRIGYCGYLKRQLDWDLLATLAARHADWQWIFVGKRSPHPELGPVIESLERRPNVHFLGEKPTRELAQYPQHFDACIMPYRMDDYTKYIFPLKLHEYLASGTPVVGTPIRTLAAFGHVVELARGDEEWSRALGRALEPGAGEPAAVAHRQGVANQYDWGTLVDRVADVVERTVARAEVLS